MKLPFQDRNTVTCEFHPMKPRKKSMWVISGTERTYINLCKSCYNKLAIRQFEVDCRK